MDGSGLGCVAKMVAPEIDMIGVVEKPRSAVLVWLLHGLEVVWIASEVASEYQSLNTTGGFIVTLATVHSLKLKLGWP